MWLLNDMKLSVTVVHVVKVLTDGDLEFVWILMPTVLSSVTSSPTCPSTRQTTPLVEDQLSLNYVNGSLALNTGNFRVCIYLCPLDHSGHFCRTTVGPMDLKHWNCSMTWRVKVDIPRLAQI
jgi:hypothetical protein